MLARERYLICVVLEVEGIKEVTRKFVSCSYWPKHVMIEIGDLSYRREQPWLRNNNDSFKIVYTQDLLNIWLHSFLET